MDDKTFISRFERNYRSKYEGALPNAFTALDFVGALGSVQEALLYSRLFLPEFVEMDGMVFLKDSAEDYGGLEGIRELLQEYGDPRTVEKTLNNFIIDLNFPNRLEESISGDDRLLAEQLGGYSISILVEDSRF
jgi:hypothetical protein